MSAAGEALAVQLAALLAPLGLALRGWFEIQSSDIAKTGAGVDAGMAALLVGNHGPALWHCFQTSTESRDGFPDPMDRWTRRVVTEACGRLEQPFTALFPFGKTVWPFQQFAHRAMGISASPLGILIHPQFGLWHGLRAAIVFPGLAKTCEVPDKMIHPCEKCVEKPCLSACPVSAFSERGFDVAGCRSYLDSTASSQSDSTLPDCMGRGCAARNACPVGREWRYDGPQLRFHMSAFGGSSKKVS